MPRAQLCQVKLFGYEAKSSTRPKFLDKTAGLESNVRTVFKATFGHRRRWSIWMMCPGQALSGVPKLLQVFNKTQNLEKAKKLSYLKISCAVFAVMLKMLTEGLFVNGLIDMSTSRVLIKWRMAHSSSLQWQIITPLLCEWTFNHADRIKKRSCKVHTFLSTWSDFEAFDILPKPNCFVLWFRRRQMLKEKQFVDVWQNGQDFIVPSSHCACYTPHSPGCLMLE